MIAIDNECPHYLPSPESITYGVRAFDAAGVRVMPQAVRHHQFLPEHPLDEALSLPIQEIFRRLGE